MLATSNEKYLIWKFTAYEIRHYARIALAPHRKAYLYAGIQLAGTWDVPAGIFGSLCMHHGKASAACLPETLYVDKDITYSAADLALVQLALYLKITGRDIPDDEVITFSYPKKA